MELLNGDGCWGLGTGVERVIALIKMCVEGKSRSSNVLYHHHYIFNHQPWLIIQFCNYHHSSHIHHSIP